MANHRLLFFPFERKRCNGHHRHASIARGPFQTTRDPFHGYPYSSTVSATNAWGCDLDDPSLPRQPDGSVAKPPPGGLFCPACADH
eukprot:4638473-Pyramimonas_sp.AAC.1